jgi:hypothetical protein
LVQEADLKQGYQKSPKPFERALNLLVLFPAQLPMEVRNVDLLEWLTWGGGGYGDPLARDAKLVALEVHRRLVSFEGAKRYGFIVKPDFTVGEKGTEALRTEMKKARGDKNPEVFNRGGTLEETGLEAAKYPWEVPMRGPHTGLPNIRKWMEEHGQKVVHLRK